MNERSTFLKKAISLVIIFVISIDLCFSHNSIVHDDYFNKIIVGANKQLSEKEQKKIKLLCFASRISIDQFNNKYEEELRYLQNNGIKTINSIDEINFTSNSHHQRYTHMGWDFIYTDSAPGNWELRKKLLLDTVGKVFPAANNEQRNAFSALVYYIHILGDHDGDNISNAFDRMPLGGENDNDDIVSELSRKVLPKLFNNHSKSENLRAELAHINFLCSELLKRKEDGLYNVKRTVSDLTESEYVTYQKYARYVLTKLSREMPSLLCSEDWFIKAFPSLK